MGVVYIPLANEIYCAQQDLDVATLNQEPIKVSSVDSLSEATFACDWIPYNLERRKDMIRWLDVISQHVRQIKSLGSTASDLASLAAGRIDIYLNPGVKPWDLAASTFIVEKAGGTVTTPSGKPWDVFNSDALVTNSLLHAKMLEFTR